MDDIYKTRITHRIAMVRSEPRYSGSRCDLAALLYAQYKGVTEEPEDRRKQFKDQLDSLIDVMKPEEWNALDNVGVAYGETMFKGLLQYCMDHTNAKALAAYEATRDDDTERDDDRSL